MYAQLSDVSASIMSTITRSIIIQSKQKFCEFV